jgi:hypothetical protein
MIYNSSSSGLAHPSISAVLATMIGMLVLVDIMTLWQSRDGYIIVATIFGTLDMRRTRPDSTPRVTEIFSTLFRFISYLHKITHS